MGNADVHSEWGLSERHPIVTRAQYIALQLRVVLFVVPVDIVSVGLRSKWTAWVLTLEKAFEMVAIDVIVQLVVRFVSFQALWTLPIAS